MSAATDRLRFTYPDDVPQLRLPVFTDAVLAVRAAGRSAEEIHAAVSTLISADRIDLFTDVVAMNRYLRCVGSGKRLFDNRTEGALLVVEATQTFDRGIDCFVAVNEVLHSVADRVSAAMTLPVVIVDLDHAHTRSVKGPDFRDPDGPAKVIERAQKEGISVVKTRAATLQQDLSAACDYLKRCSL